MYIDSVLLGSVICGHLRLALNCFYLNLNETLICGQSQHDANGYWLARQ